MKDKNSTKRAGRKRRHMSIRRRVHGTQERPRLSVYRSLNHIHAQIINDDEGETLVAASSLKLDLPADSAKTEKKSGDGEKKTDSKKMKRSREVGKLLAEKAREKGITKVAFDRGGFKYHGRIAAFAEEARKNGLDF